MRRTWNGCSPSSTTPTRSDYAAWLAQMGHRVRLIDPVPLHIEQAAAAHPDIHAELGDARALPVVDDSVDAALLLGPLYHRDRLHEPAIAGLATSSTATGVFRGHEHGLFTTAYFHHPHELVDEVACAGFDDVRIFNIEGPGFLLVDFEARWNDPARREAILAMARLLEDEPTTLGVSSHLLAVATVA